MRNDSKPRGLFARLARALEELRVGLCRLNQIQYSAPWRPDPRSC